MANEGVIRQGHREPFTVLYKAAIRDSRLSFEMLGFLVYMLDKPPDWEFTISGMASERGCGRDCVRRLVGRLEEAGYLLREQSHDENGKFAQNIYVLQERPPLSGNPDNGEVLNLPLSGKPVNGKTRQRFLPLTGNPTQLKTNNTKDYNIPPYNPPTNSTEIAEVTPRKRAAKSVPKWKPDRFEGFWQYYPRGENRAGAVKAWDALKPDDALIDTIAAALRVLKTTEEWQRGIGIPHAATFLRGRRWEDANAKRPPSPSKPARRADPPPDEGGEWTWTE